MGKFDDIYKELVENNENELEANRTSYLLKIIFLILIVLIFLMFVLVLKIDIESKIKLILAIGVSCFFISGFYTVCFKKKYSSIFKEKVVDKFIKLYNEKLIYEPYGIMPRNYYEDAGFKTDGYFCQDVIKGTFENHTITMAEVYIPKGQEFRGLFSVSELKKSFQCDIKVCSNKNMLEKVLVNNKNKLEMDSSEFEKYFDIYANDKIKAMQLLTADVMDEMIKFTEMAQMKFELIINNRNIYIRFHTGNVFEANTFKSSVEYESLKEIYNIINFTINVTRKLVKISEETEI